MIEEIYNSLIEREVISLVRSRKFNIYSNCQNGPYDSEDAKNYRIEFKKMIIEEYEQYHNDLTAADHYIEVTEKFIAKMFLKVQELQEKYPNKQE